MHTSVLYDNYEYYYLLYCVICVGITICTIYTHQYCVFCLYVMQSSEYKCKVTNKRIQSQEGHLLFQHI